MFDQTDLTILVECAANALKAEDDYLLQCAQSAAGKISRLAFGRIRTNAITSS